VRIDAVVGTKVGMLEMVNFVMVHGCSNLLKTKS
jgi:hypothetical protein